MQARNEPRTRDQGNANSREILVGRQKKRRGRHLVSPGEKIELSESFEGSRSRSGDRTSKCERDACAPRLALQPPCSTPAANAVALLLMMLSERLAAAAVAAGIYVRDACDAGRTIDRYSNGDEQDRNQSWHSRDYY